MYNKYLDAKTDNIPDAEWPFINLKDEKKYWNIHFFNCDRCCVPIRQP